MKTPNTQTHQTKESRYSDPKNRTRKTNQTALFAITFIELLLVFALFFQTFAKETPYGKLGVIPLLILALGIVLNWIIYKKDKSSEKLRYIMLSTFAIGWVYLIVTGVNVVVPFYIYPVIIATILYHDRKFEKISFNIVLITNIIRALIFAVKNIFATNEIAFICTVVNFEVIIIVHVIAKLSEQYSHDMLEAVSEERDLQEDMLHDILRVSENVKKEVIDTNDLIENLRDSSVSVHSSVKEISTRTQETAESVQEQTKMTSLIRQSIGETAENAKVIVSAVTDSAKMMEENMAVIQQIHDGAATINETNTHMATSMEELQQKAKEVQEITEVIFSISSQTNLLALNASIESARAGEAGRGFAVVADQIRNLSEETRQSTEKIASIVQELNNNAQDATKIVQASIDAMNQQNQMVENASVGFKAVRDNMDTLTQRVEDIDKKINNLVESNNSIIESINQLSASSEAVSESAKEVEALSLQNQTEAAQAKELLCEVQNLVQEFEKYQNS